jgi:Gpi18-like mannosyltransferase
LEKDESFLIFHFKERPAWACIFFGLAISFKLQAIFFLPVLFIESGVAPICFQREIAE